MTLLDAVEKRGRPARAFIVQTGESLYYNQHGELVARALGSTARTPRARAEGGLKYKSRDAHRYSEEELARISEDIEAEEVRGAEFRYWEDVQVGDTLVPLVKGPLNITDMICWYSGAGHTYKAHERAARYRRRHPADSFKNHATGAEDSAARGHAEAKMAREVGMPGGYDVGPQRISWMGQAVTNWMGDSGFMRSLKARVLRPNIFGDTSWCRGTVTAKRTEEAGPVVELDIKVENQLGETTAVATASVRLPTRADAAGQAGSGA